MLGRDEKCSQDFPNFSQGFGLASISEAREVSKSQQVGFHQGCDTGVVSRQHLKINPFLDHSFSLIPYNLWVSLQSGPCSVDCCPVSISEGISLS